MGGRWWPMAPNATPDSVTVMAEPRRPRRRRQPDWGDPDPEYVLEQRDPERSPRERMVDGTRRLLLFGLLAVVLAAMGGYLLARSSPQVAARLLVRDAVVSEPFGTSTEGPAPTSGSDAFGITDRCGPRDVAVSVDDQRQAVYSGVVVVQVRDRDLLADAEDWAATQDGLIITAPNPDLEQEVVATAWTRRMTLNGVNRELLTGFLIAHGRMGPARATC